MRFLQRFSRSGLRLNRTAAFSTGGFARIVPLRALDCNVPVPTPPPRPAVPL